VSALALRRASWSHPELGAAAPAALAWAALAAHAATPHGHAAAGGAPAAAVLAAAGGWLAMCAAMMLPGALADLRAVALGALWRRRGRTVALFGGAYLAVPAAFGLVALPLAAATGLGLAIPLALAAAWELTPWKWRALRRCHLIDPLPPSGSAADAACVRAGLRYGGACLVACAPLMLVAAAAGHRALVLMALLTVLVSAEKLVVRSARLRVPAAAALAAAAVLAAAA
jgi:predicted metal-binding membrane protein